MLSIAIFSIFHYLAHTLRSRSCPKLAALRRRPTVDNATLAIVKAVTPPCASAREWVGTCFYGQPQNTWLCRDAEYNLDHTSREPIGGCQFWTGSIDDLPAQGVFTQHN
jgi:hypothetical protein